MLIFHIFNLQLGISHAPKIKNAELAQTAKSVNCRVQQLFELDSHSLNQRATLVTSKLGSSDSKLTTLDLKIIEKNETR
ncbi:hypothetical protein C1S99_26665 [Vibrio parahaemolyticus]|nr:hypothetical protein C1T12_26905 [Vibrio parahaemolyticus]PMS56730.1 hypothetical protein C1S91_26745 [Vibrio parahaemolyticus]PMS65091.1 hypothetical protein C1S96_26815 [Vibrio parahaemolyticus]PMS70299.1 hypothetical protein C1T10_26745 [Vibrio parahaemolyticus]PMS72443.1 hypothetical protein C1S88_26775 [Vibrio parahaemolyticus]